MSFFKTRQDAFSLGRFMATTLLLERNPLQSETESNPMRGTNQSLLLQFFLLRFATVNCWGDDDGPAERLQHGLRAGFTEKHPHLAGNIEKNDVLYVCLVEGALTPEVIHQAGSQYCKAIGCECDLVNVMAAAGWISTTLTNFHNTVSKIAEEARLT